MIKRTPQEIADFFGCYVAMDKNLGSCWYGYSLKPHRENTLWFSHNEEPLQLYIPSEVINIPANHDWTKLYEPAVKEDIPEKKKAKKIVPYDLSLKEDRDALRGKWIVSEDDETEFLVRGFVKSKDGWLNEDYENGEDLFKNYTFLDGSPVGKEVEE